MRKTILAGLCISVGIYAHAFDIMREMAQAYSSQNWKQVRQLLEKVESSPQKTLYEGFYNLGSSDGNKYKGLKLMKSLLEEKNQQVKLQAMLAYARNIEIMKMRPDLYPDASSQPSSIKYYDKLIKNFPASKEACYAIVFKSRNLINNAGKNKVQVKLAIAEVENFLSKSQEHNKNFLGIVHWFLANEYITTERNYKKAVEHLIRAEKYGITNPRVTTEIRFQIGRIYDIKLKDKKNALKYYKLFVKHYPESRTSRAIKHFIKELKRGKR